jgi:hypothetical protein
MLNMFLSLRFLVNDIWIEDVNYLSSDVSGDDGEEKLFLMFLLAFKLDAGSDAVSRTLERSLV